VSPDQFQHISGYRFKQTNLLKQALTHRSFSQTHNNERLEFLGDSVLGLVISQFIFQQLPEANEGELSRIRASLVKEDTLANVARDIDLGDHIHLGGGELKSGGFRRSSILSDALEAIIGAIYLDSSFEQAKDTVLYFYRDYLQKIPDSQALKDPKTQLQELLQGQQKDLPNYEVVQTVGKDHEQTFTVKCQVESISLETTGKGTSRKKAEQVAAETALRKLLS